MKHSSSHPKTSLTLADIYTFIVCWIFLTVTVSSTPLSTPADGFNLSLIARDTNALCGKQNGGALCSASVGTCCSQYGYCGSTADYCSTGCQSGSCIYTTDGTCGAQHGGRLCTPSFGSCCSSYGYCGNSTAYCGQGCQSGSCMYSKDNTCGSRNGGLLCSSQFGNCCSQYGYCGNSSDYCAAGCQSGSCTTGVVKYAGVNYAGCDFGMDTDGTSGTPNCPSTAGPAQMQHFAKYKFNMYRLPVGWQYLVNNQLGGPLDPTFFSTYDSLVQQCLKTGAYCIIDIHNYARWNGGIIDQAGGPSGTHLNSVLSQMARHYAPQSKVVMGIMNEPHDLDVNLWAKTVQSAVYAIRAAGAKSQMILIPGTDWCAASSFVQDSAPAMSTVVDADGSTSKLIYDIHQYFDGPGGNGGGNDITCTTDHVTNGFAPLARYLRSNGRQALMTETGGGDTSSCLTYVCSALDFFNANNDVFLGWVGWAAGSFDNTYPLSETPNGNTDTRLVSQCLGAKFAGSS